MDLTLYTQTNRCKTADRQREIDECLRRNLNHPGIRKLVLFKEPHTRISDAKWFRWAQHHGSGQRLSADIPLHEGLKRLAAALIRSPKPPARLANPCG